MTSLCDRERCAPHFVIESSVHQRSWPVHSLLYFQENVILHDQDDFKKAQTRHYILAICLFYCYVSAAKKIVTAKQSDYIIWKTIVYLMN